ncbi:polysaccharide biosynthesis tyrosine autokinase [Novosphingobium sp. TH158]|uniref:GumC family protein n=1 Tax=Novosphingobium sp. TH158 TaxID=2067455 RepID=UPI000C799680|nr:polysaccharide biosynthesis tyrosine autokinase [Novosphingobium sp. TH158]PLK27152.1 capsular biosynthesis protein [Novosphingobium sp. TH158]
MTAQTIDQTGAVSASPYGPHPGAVSGVELRDVLRVISEHRRVILGGGVLGLILGIIATLLMTPLYRATALMEVNNQSTEMIEGAGRGGQQYQSRGANQELLATQLGLLKSEQLAKRVVEDLNLASSPDYGGQEGTREQRTKRAVALVRAGTSVDQVKGAMLIQVSHVAKDPASAANIANALGRGFIASSLERRFDNTSYARKFLSDQLARTKAALEESERNLNNYSMQSGVFRTQSVTVEGKTSEGATLAQSNLSALNEAYSQARVRRIAAEQAYKNASVTFAADQTSAVGTLVPQRAELQSQYDEKLKVFKPDYPAMVELKARIDRLDATISGERGRVSSSKREELYGEYKAALRTEAQLEAQVSASKGEVQGERGRSIEYNILQREADTNRALYDALLQRYKEVGVAGGIGQSNVAMVDAATPPGGAFSPRLPVNALIGLILGLTAGIALAFILHLLFDTVIDTNDVRSKLNLPVLGVIPMDTEDRTLQEALADRKSDISEAYYSVRTALRFSQAKGVPKTLLITSTRPGEGKSSSAFAIASSMARLGTKVLLLDADLRKPTFVSSRSDGYGLAHLLGTEEPLSAYIEKTQIENLELLPVGRFVGSAAELLSSNRLPVIISEAEQAYQMVVIDGPPVLGLTDAPLLGSVAEATAIVIESRLSRTSNVTEMVRRLNAAGAKIIGVILTKVTSGHAGYGYNYYSYSYGSDGIGGRVSSDPSRALDLGKPER